MCDVTVRYFSALWLVVCS